MSKTATVRARIEPQLEEEGGKPLREDGTFLPPKRFSMFYRQIALRKGLPFDVVIPNKTTRKTFRRYRCGKRPGFVQRC